MNKADKETKDGQQHQAVFVYPSRRQRMGAVERMGESEGERGKTWVEKGEKRMEERGKRKTSV